ncbi:hypothetical protein FYL46_004449 [Escherichia coli]|nr:hypothetical protein [Escherichia coli]EES0535539.1 hypothetical protein [Escherichia coli]EES0885256.1 hypothetical protein [Escherichia coli]EES2104605.1 hypothetical protein [Escherichia coli]
MQWKYLPAKRSHLRGRLPEIKTTDGEVIMGQEEKYELKKLIGEDVMSAFYPHESELSRRVKQLIRAAKKQLEALCAMK